MKIITISREFGSGGRELGKRIADVLGFAYYDREIITAIAENKGLDENYVNNILESNIWQAVPITFRHSFTIPAVMNNTQTELLLEQRKVIEEIAYKGQDCVIVGRNADIILEKYNPFSIFVCADIQTKVKRCIERAEKGEQLTKKQIEQNMKRIDKNRASSREIICDFKWGDPKAYDLTVNTTCFDIKALAPAVADYVMHLIGGQNENTVI